MKASNIHLTFASETVSVAYDGEVLYVAIPGEPVLAYTPVSQPMGYSIMAGNKDALSSIQRIIVGIPTTRPKGLDWITLYLNEVDMYDVDSSTVKAVGYDRYTLTLYVQYHTGDIYRYQNVPADYWSALQNAESKGSWVHWFLKINADSFPYSQVIDAVLVPAGKMSNPGSPHPDGWMTGFKEIERK